MVGGVSLCQAEVTVTLEGAISGLSGVTRDSNFFNPSDPISLTFTFDETMGGTLTGSRSFDRAISSFSGRVGTYEFGGSSGSTLLRNDLVGSIFGGNPYDNVGIRFNSEIVVGQSDFDYDSGPVGGFALRSILLNVQTDDTTMLDSLDLDGMTFENTENFLDLYTFNLSFSNNPIGLVPGSVFGSFDSISITPTPGALSSLAIAGFFSTRRRRVS